MKRIIIIILIVLIIASCNNRGNNAVSQSHRDSTITVVAYSFNWDLNDHRIASALRITIDSAGKKDTIYQVYVNKILADSATKKPILDSLGQTIIVYDPMHLAKEYLLEDYYKDY